MELDEQQKAICLVLWFKPGWRSPASVAHIISLLEDEFKQLAGRLVTDGVLESRTINVKKQDPDRWGQWTTRKQYRLSERGKELVKALVDVIEQRQNKGKL